MSDSHSTPDDSAGKPVKPSKPHPEFPLTAHPAGQNGLTDRLIRYGQEFKRPSQKMLRLDRARKGPKRFAPQRFAICLKPRQSPCEQ